MESWNIICQLYGNSRAEYACMADISIASWEEEAGSETLLLEVVPSNSMCNRGLSRARQTVQLEDTLLILSVSLAVYLLKKVDIGIKEVIR